jgi:hypothetical protein
MYISGLRSNCNFSLFGIRIRYSGLQIIENSYIFPSDSQGCQAGRAKTKNKKNLAKQGFPGIAMDER